MPRLYDPATEAILNEFAVVLTPAHIVQRYPPTNDAWTYDAETNSFSADASSLACGRNSDPWRRAFRSTAKPHHDREGELTHSTTSTTVRGVEFDLTIWND